MNGVKALASATLRAVALERNPQRKHLPTGDEWGGFRTFSTISFKIASFTSALLSTFCRQLGSSVATASFLDEGRIIALILVLFNRGIRGQALPSASRVQLGSDDRLPFVAHLTIQRDASDDQRQQ